MQLVVYICHSCKSDSKWMQPLSSPTTYVHSFRSLSQELVAPMTWKTLELAEAVPPRNIGKIKLPRFRNTVVLYLQRDYPFVNPWNMFHKVAKRSKQSPTRIISLYKYPKYLLVYFLILFIPNSQGSTTKYTKQYYIKVDILDRSLACWRTTALCHGPQANCVNSHTSM